MIFSVGAVSSDLHSSLPVVPFSASCQILTTIAAGPPHGLSLIYAGRVLAGYGIGAISAVAPAYVSECAPKEVRGRITGLFQIMVAIGVMISYFVNCTMRIYPLRTTSQHHSVYRRYRNPCPHWRECMENSVRFAAPARGNHGIWSSDRPGVYTHLSIGIISFD